jgi:hypothetical protein
MLINFLLRKLKYGWCFFPVKRDTSLLDLNSFLQESSQCQVPELARACFPSNTIQMSIYFEKFCTSNDDNLQDGEEKDENLPPCVLVDQVMIMTFKFLLVLNVFASFYLLSSQFQELWSQTI